MSQVEYSLHHCYQQVNDLLARYNGQTQAEGYSEVYKSPCGAEGEEKARFPQERERLNSILFSVVLRVVEVEDSEF